MKVLHWIGIAIAASMALMAALIAAAPTLLSTSWGQGLCLKAASRAYPGSIELQSLSMGWLSGIDVRGLKVKDPQGKDLLSCAQFSLDKPLVSFVFSQKDFGSIHIVSPVIYCYGSKNTRNSSKEDPWKGSDSYSKNEKKENKKPFEKTIESSPVQSLATPDLKGHITVSDGQLIALVDDHVIGTMSQGEASFDLDLLRASNGKIAASLSQNSSKLTPISLIFSINGAPQLLNIKGSFSLSCNKIPTELLAALAHSLHPDIADFLKESFGSSISYSLSATANGPAIVLHSTLLSDNLRSEINMKVENDIITVDKGDLLTGTVSPNLFHLLMNQGMPPNGQVITLLSPTTCSLENTCPLSFHLSALDLTSPLDIHFSTKTPFSLSMGASKPPVAIAMNVSLQGDPQKPSASLDITASSIADTATFHFTASGSKKNTGYQLSTLMHINGTWPAIAETFSPFPAASLFGPDIIGVVKADGYFNSVDDFSFQGESQMTSRNIQKKASFSCTNKLFSVSQASFDAKIPTSLIEKYGATPRFSNPAGSVHVQSTVNSISLPLDHFTPVFSEAIIDAKVQVEAPTISLQPHDGLDCSLESSEISITKSEKSPAANFSVRAKAPVTSKTQPLITTLVGPTGLHLTMTGKYDLKQSTVTVNTADFSTSRLSASFHDMSCSFGKGLEVSLASPAIVRLVADKDMVDLLSSSPLPCTLAGPTELSATIKPFTLSEKNGIWQGSPLSAELHGKDIRIAGKQSFGPYSMSIPVTFDITRRMITADPGISSDTMQLLKGTSTVTLRENADLPLMENITLECAAELSHLPTAILELLSQQSLVPIIGDDLSSKLSCKFYGLSSKGNHVALSSTSAFLKTNIDLALDAKRLSEGSGSAVDIEAFVSPKSFEAMKAMMGMKSDVTIGNNVTVHIKVPQCAADLSPFISQNTQQISLWKVLEALSISAEASFSAVELRQKGAAIGRLSPCIATSDLQGKSHSLRFAVDSSDSSSDAMSIALKGSFDTIWNKDGLCLPSSHLRSTINVDRFPTLLLDVVLPQQGALLEESIGKTIRIVGDFSADEMKSGTMKLDLQSTHCSMHLDGIIQNGKMTLKNPAKASLTITKQAGTLLLKNVNPLLATAVHSQKPIQLTIDSEGAVIPLIPFSITNVCLPKVTADVGKIVVKNGGALKVILALLNMGQAANSEDLDVWLTPIYMKVQGGVINCQRADALVANKIHMITWGDVDLGQDRIKMVVAIPEETLTALRLKIVSPTPERGLQIPITGSSSNPKVDTTPATARLAGAGILNNSGDKRLQMFGGLLQAAAATMGEPDQPIPPRTTQPFPWDK
jgi:hypothetical protein